MTLIKSISGIRGTIGGQIGENLTPLDAVKFAAAYADFIQKSSGKKNAKVVMGRDARLSGAMIQSLVANTLVGMGIDVVDCGLSTTPTIEMMVPHLNADGGIILTASHNPKQWNALKLLNNKGEFIGHEEGAALLEAVEAGAYTFADVDDLGSIEKFEGDIDFHIEEILKLKYVDPKAIAKKNLKVVVDSVHSVGGISIPPLLRALGVTDIIEMYSEPTGHFPHNPEPLKEHLTEICERIKSEKADLGIVVDPDVDRLAFITEEGVMFGEEYTLVAIADYLLQKEKGHTVSNLSSSRALRDIALRHGGTYSAAAVGEVNVVLEMKKHNTIVGGEGNGGIILPELHYGRDALVGTALFLTHFAHLDMTMSAYKKSLPQYEMSKNKIELSATDNPDEVLAILADKYKHEEVSLIDGVKIDKAEGWVHFRKSNTEPIIRIYSEAATASAADALAQQFIKEIEAILAGTLS